MAADDDVRCRLAAMKLDDNCRLAAINDELKEMGGDQTWSELYTSLPHGVIPKEEYRKHLAEMNEKLSQIELKKTRATQPRNVSPCDLERFERELKASISGLQREEDGLKATMLIFMESREPFDEAPFLQRKRKLLDEKFELLKHMRTRQTQL
jgi:hypothetical protein